MERTRIQRRARRLKSGLKAESSTVDLRRGGIRTPWSRVPGHTMDMYVPTISILSESMYSLTIHGQYQIQFPPTPPVSTTEFEDGCPSELAEAEAFHHSFQQELSYSDPTLSASLSAPSMALSMLTPSDANPSIQPCEESAMLYPSSPPLSSTRSACPSPTAHVAPPSPKRRRQRRPATAAPPKSVPCIWIGCSKLYSRKQEMRRHIASVSPQQQSLPASHPQPEHEPGGIC